VTIWTDGRDLVHDIACAGSVDGTCGGCAVDPLAPPPVNGRSPASKDPPAEPDQAARTVVRRLVTFVTAHYRLGTTGTGLEYAVPVDPDQPRLVRTLGGAFQRSLAARLYDATGEHHTRSTWENVLMILRGKAAEQEPEQLHLRVARHGDGLVLDLGDRTGRVVHITAHGWQVCTPEQGWPLFRRTRVTRALPEPVRGGDLTELRELLAFDTGTDADTDRWALTEGWLVAAPFPDVPRPLLTLTGQQGSGKSERARMLLSVLDPGELGHEPGRNARDDATSAAARHLTGWDNVTKVSPATSDALCRMVTGDAQVTRALYTDDEAHEIAFMRTGVLTAINMPAGLGADALERLVHLPLNRLPDTDRAEVATLRQRFAAAHPRILGALLDAVSGVLAELATARAETDRLPRMADHGVILAALDRHTGGDHLPAYRQAVHRALAERALADPVVAAVVAFMTGRDTWTGEPAALRRELTEPLGAPWWPQTASHLVRALNRQAELLRSAGVAVSTVRRAGRRLVELRTVAVGDGLAGDGTGDGNW